MGAEAPASGLEAALGALREKLGPGVTGIARLRRLSGGASQETWAFDAVSPAGARPLILRRRPPMMADTTSAAPLATEAELQRRVAQQGAPVPEIVHVAEPAEGIGEAYVMGAVAGETLGRRIVRDAAFDAVRPDLARQCGAVLAAIHRTPLEGLPPLTTIDAAEDVARYEEQYRLSGAVRPVLEAAFQLLKRRIPDPVTPTLVHGDFRNGNIMFDPQQGIAAVLDWELARLGDPASDMGWVCTASWRFGGAKPVGGFGDYADMLRGYREAGGADIPLERVLFYEMLGSLKWGVMCLGMYRSYADGVNTSVERPMIGRRVSETEIDLTNLMRRMAA